MPKITTLTHTSAGGVVYRERGDAIDVALINAGEKRRWQLPKGIVESGESPEAAALREVREETGIDAELVAPIDRIEYWYVAQEKTGRARIHKFVHFFLMRYVGGDVADHDREVHEARWIEIGAAIEMLAFASEKKIVERATGLLDRAR